MSIWQSNNRGADAYQWGVYETKRFLGAIWPVVAAAATAYVTARIAELQAGGSLLAAGLLAAAFKALQLYLSNNSKVRA